MGGASPMWQVTVHYPPREETRMTHARLAAFSLTLAAILASGPVLVFADDNPASSAATLGGDVAAGAADVASDAAVGAGNVAGSVAGPIPQKAGEIAGSAADAAGSVAEKTLDLTSDILDEIF